MSIKVKKQIIDLPLVDLHRHLEGSIRIQTVIDVCREHHLDLPSFDESELKKKIQVNNPVANYESLYAGANLIRQIFVDYGICHRVANEFLVDAKREDLDYVEVRFSPLFISELHQLDPYLVTRTICQSLRESSKSIGIEYGVIITLTREYGAEDCNFELEAALKNISYGVVAIDLAGDEQKFPSELFIDHFSRAKAAGLHLIAHAGEFHDASSVNATIMKLNVQRIGHGVRAIEDVETISLIKDKGIFIECCPTSNYLTSAVKNLESHPISFFVKNSIKATLNTDDPTMFQSVTIKDEYRKAAEIIGLTPEEIRIIKRNGIEGTFSYTKKDFLLSQI